MALTGVQIFKLLPKTNCGECGVPTCLAFAMNLAAGKAELSKCPYVTEDAKKQLESASAPPIRTVEFGPPGETAVKTGGETVLFRHEKTFYNKTVIAVRIDDNEADERINEKISSFNQLRYKRVGLELGTDAIAIRCNSGSTDKFTSLIKKVVEAVKAPLILMCEDPEIIKASMEYVKNLRPLIYAATEKNYEKMSAIAKECKCPLVVKAEGLEALSSLTEKISKLGIVDIVLDSGARNIKAALEDNIIIRRLAIQKTFRPLGYPTIGFPCEMASDIFGEATVAAMMIPKYTGIIVLSDIKGELLFPLLLQRLNIYTDPQRPMKTEEGLYNFSNPGPNSPVLVTSNFSLTYFIVSGEIENSRQPAYLLVLDTDGLSVLTSWAAGKFSGEAIGALVKKLKIAEKLEKKKLVLPGAVASISGDVEEELGSEWNVMIGPRDASAIPAFLKQSFS